MALFGFWHGGHSYARSERDDPELFDSITQAKRVLEDRYNSNGQRKVHFEFVVRDPVQAFVPAVDRTSTIELFYSDDPLDLAESPDRIVRFGPRGGVVVEVNR